MNYVTGRRFAMIIFIVLLIHQTVAMDGVWTTSTRFDGEKSQATLSWYFSTTEDVTSISIKKGEDDITSYLSTSKKYRLEEPKTTKGIKITLTVYNITTLDSDVYRCSFDQLGYYRDIQLIITDLMPVFNPVISTLHQNVELIWKYNNQHRQPANKLIFSRQNTKLAEWTINEGFSAEDDHFRRKPIFTKTEDGEIDVITLTIRDAYMHDFNKIYYCDLFSDGHNILKSEIKLEVELPEWVNPRTTATAELGKEVTFTWQYKYRFQPLNIYFRQRCEASAKLEFIGWYGDKFNRDESYKHMVKMNQTSNGDGGVTKVTIFNTTEDLFGCAYQCDIIFQDGQGRMSEIKLIREPEWVNPRSRVTAGVGEEVTFTWQYKYSIQPRNISLTQRRETSANVDEDIGYWLSIELFKFQRYEGLVTMTRTTSGEGETIQLTIWNTTNDMFDSWFKCLITFQDGEEIALEMKLIGVDSSQKGFTDYHPVSMDVSFSLVFLFVPLLMLSTRLCMDFRRKCQYYRQLPAGENISNTVNGYTAPLSTSSPTDDSHIHESFD